MRVKALCAYALLLILVYSAHAFAPGFFDYLIPVYLVAAPPALGHRVKMNVSAKDMALTVIISGAVLLPVLLFFHPAKRFHLLAPVAMAVQLIGVCFPEEFFFRGFLQESFGNNFWGVVFTSLLFAVAHLPGLFISGDYYAPLTFFPSLIMGFLYLRTSSVIPPAIFHFLANVVYLGSL